MVLLWFPTSGTWPEEKGVGRGLYFPAAPWRRGVEEQNQHKLQHTNNAPPQELGRGKHTERFLKTIGVLYAAKKRKKKERKRTFADISVIVLRAVMKKSRLQAYWNCQRDLSLGNDVLKKEGNVAGKKGQTAG